MEPEESEKDIPPVHLCVEVCVCRSVCSWDCMSINEFLIKLKYYPVTVGDL